MRQNRDQRLTRRELLKLSAAGVASASMSGWFELLAREAGTIANPGAKRKSCILLWMDGGPSQTETFDPKPEASTGIRGEFKSIATAIPGVQICEKLPRLAPLMKHAAILRGMSTEEADHGRARVYMHTGYRPGVGGVTYPGLGSTVSAELGSTDSPLPNFVVTGVPLNKYEFLTNPGFRGPRHQPLVLADPAKGLENLKPVVPADDFNDRLSVLEKLEQNFARTYPGPASDAHRTTLGRTVQLLRSSQGQVFDLSLEPERVRTAYGDHYFGRSCLLARRLVEAGVAFVEVYLSNWDGHSKPEAERARSLLGPLDQGMAALITDLKERGLLDSTLILWMGEFGRTPRINRDSGRDHYSRAWSTVLVGGNIKEGQVIGKTDREGMAVVDRPISVLDFLATVCRVLGIDPTRKIETPSGRPIQIVDHGAKPIVEVIGA